MEFLEKIYAYLTRSNVKEYIVSKQVSIIISDGFATYHVMTPHT